MSVSSTAVKGRVLIVDDDGALARLYSLRLITEGHFATTAGDGEEAARLLAEQEYDAIVCDVKMPRMGGMELLRLVRGRDLDVPVILITGAPSPAAASTALEHGAFRYLTKPFSMAELLSVVRIAIQASRLARLKREALDLVAGGGQGIGDRIGLEVRYERALASLWMDYQPIVSWSRKELFGYEALVRTAEATLSRPAALIDAAVRLGRTGELSLVARNRAAADFASAPQGATLFVNIFLTDLIGTDLYLPDAPLSRLAQRVVFEVTERVAVDEVSDLRARATVLRSLGFRLAIDDLGAGYSGLNSFSLLSPDVAKLDMSLVRGIDGEPVKQRIVRSMISLFHDASILVVAEGVETAPERDQLAALGCDLMQGFLFGRPAKPFVEASL